MRCNRILTVKRANPDDDSNNDAGLVGALELEGDEKAEETTLMAGYPAAMLQNTKSEKSELNLPTDTRRPGQPNCVAAATTQPRAIG